MQLDKQRVQWQALVNTVMNWWVPWEVLDYMHNYQLLKDCIHEVSRYMQCSLSG